MLNIKRFMISCVFLAVSTAVFAKPSSQVSKIEQCYELHGNTMNCGLTDDDIPDIIQYYSQSGQDGAGVFLSKNQITDKGLIALSKAVKLIYIDISENKITDQGAIALAQNSTLQDIDISGNAITDVGGIALANSVNIDRLRLNNTKISDATVIALANNKNMRDIELQHNNITDAGAKAFSRGYRGYVFLDLSWNNITDQGAESLARVVDDGVIVLDHNNIGDQGLIAFGKSTSKDQSGGVSLAYNHITDDGLIRYLDIIAANQSTSIPTNLEGNQLTDVSADALANMNLPPLVTQIDYLSIGNNKITIAGIQKIISSGKFNLVDIANSHYGDAITEIYGKTNFAAADLSGNDITDIGIATLMQNKNLIILTLDNNHITDKGLMLLTQNRGYDTLSLANNQITDAGILELLKKMIHIKFLIISGNKISEQTIQLMKDSQIVDDVTY